MRQHVLAYHFTTLVAGITLAQIPAVAEQAFTISGAGNFQVPWPLNILAGYAGATGLTQARINTGSLRARGFPNIYPLSATNLPAPPVPVFYTHMWPLHAAKEEDLRIDASTTAAVQDVVALLWVTPEAPNYNVPPGDLRALPFTCTPTGVAFGWSAPVAIALQDNIEGGVYDIYGLAIQQASGIAGRLILQGEFFRPGVLCQAALTGQQDRLFWGGLGKWGSFNTYSPPQLETFNNAAGASAVFGWLLAAKSSQPTVTTVPGAPGTAGY